MAGWVKGLLAGVAIGVAATLLVQRLSDEATVPERLAESLGCPEPALQTAAHASRAGRYSDWAADHASEILGIGGCTAGPATLYLRFGESIPMSHVLATLDDFDAVCVVDHGLFDGQLLADRRHLEELCAEVGGELKKL